MAVTNGTPPGLGKRGTAFWKAVTKTYDIERPDEVELLMEACRIMSLCDSLRETVERDGFTAKGSTGQTVAHPLLTELRANRSELRHVLRQLGLPSPEISEADDEG
jgi:P27 family predicted phage terminase small subunit